MQGWQKISILGMMALAFFGTARAQTDQAQFRLPPPPRPLTAASDTSSAPPVRKQADAASTQSAQTPAAEQKQLSGSPTTYRSSVTPRPPQSGYYVGIFAGASVSQGASSLKVNNLDYNVGSELNPMGGFKFGYTWPFVDEPIDQFDAELGGPRLLLSGSLEAEAFYVRSTTRISTGKLEMDMGFLMFNALLRAGVGKWEFYGGPGAGGFVAGTTDNVGRGDTNASYAYQFMGGIDYNFQQDWSVFAEYKYLVTPDFTFGKGSSVAFHDYDQNLVMLGIRRHF